MALVYKIFRSDEWQHLQSAGETDGAAVDRDDGYIHLSSGEQVAETAARHFAEEEGLFLLAIDGAQLGDALRWELSRGGARFPHLYRRLRLGDVLWAQPIELMGGIHQIPLPSVE